MFCFEVLQNKTLSCCQLDYDLALVLPLKIHIESKSRGKLADLGN